MLVRKFLNAGELLWDSLDGRERLMLGYAAAWTLLVGLVAMRQRSRDRFRRELLAELGAADDRR